MKHITSKLLSLLLCLAMLMSMVPAAYAAGTEGTDVTEANGGASEQAAATTDAAKVGETGYTTLAEAIAAAKDGDTVKLLADVIQNTMLTIDKNITLDLNGKNIYNTENIWSDTKQTYELISVEAKVTITGNGSIEAKENDCYTINVKNGNLTIENGTFVGNVSVVQVENGTLTISGGEFKLLQKWEGSSKYLINCIDENYENKSAVVDIRGGKFVDFDPNVSPEKKVDGKAPSFVISAGIGVTKDAAGSFTAMPNMAAQIVDTDGNSVAAYATLQEAVVAAENGQTVKLLSDVTEIVTIPKDKTITLDLNGKNIGVTSGCAIVNKGTLTVTGSGNVTTSADESAAVANFPDAIATLNGGTYSSSNWYVIKNLGTMTIDGPVTVKKSDDSTDTSSLIDNGWYGNVTNDLSQTYPTSSVEVKLTIKNGAFEGKSGSASCSVVKNDDYGVLEITGGTFDSTSNTGTSNATTILNWNVATISGGTFKGSYPISNGSYDNAADQGKLTITGGNFSGTSSLFGQAQGGTSGAGKVTITDGSFNAPQFGAFDYAVEISGGTFSSAVLPEYCADGFVPTQNTDGSYGVQEYKPIEVWTGYSSTKVASYKTIAEAAAHLGDHKWIVIAKDYTLTEDFEIPEGVFLDVAKDATLTVAEGVTLTVAANAKRLGVRTDATLVNNGTIMVCGTSYSKGYVMVQDGGVLDTTKLSVPEDCFLDNNGSNYFATANENALYEITYTDGTVKKTADRSHVNKNATQVKLLKDVEVSSWVLSNVADNFVLDLGGHTLSGSKTSGYYVLYAGVNMTIKNGTIKYNAGSEKGAICVDNGATVTIDSTATIDGGSGIGIMMQGETPSHVVLNGTVTTTGAYGFASNGSANSDGNPDTCNITVNAGATIKASKGFAIYHPTLGTVTVNGGTISGHTGIEMCAGKLVVSGGSITSTGDNTDATGSQNAILDGAAISIINRNYPGGVPTAEITGGTIKATGTGMTVKAYDYKNDRVASWTDVSNYVDISGGTFSSIPDNMNALCAAGYIPFKNADGTYGVTRPSSGSSGSYDPTYSVSTPSKTENGSVTVSPKNASKGDTVTVTVKPDSGYVLETLTVTDKNGNELTLKDKGDGKYTFTMPAGKVEVKATFMEDNSVLNFFYDVPNDAYFYEAVKWAVKNGITDGVGDNLFAPGQPCTRAQIVTFLWRAAGSPAPKSTVSFADVPAGSYYAKAVAWAVENGITLGTGDGTFSPNATCTRAQSVTFLYRALGTAPTTVNGFTDVAANAFYTDAVAWAVENGVTNGTTDSTFSPNNGCTRAQIVTFLFRAYQGK